MAVVSERDVIREGLRLLSERDLDAWVESFTEDVRLHELPDLPDADVFEGREGLRRWAESLIELTDEWSWRLVAVLAQEGSVVVTETDLQVRGAASDVPVGVPVFHLFQFRDDKIAEVRAFSSRAQALETAGLEDAGV